MARDGKKHVVKIADFGLAKVRSEGRASLHLTGVQTLGTPAYMAPEQWSNTADADTRADIYSLGCTLYTLVTGAPPFAGPGLREFYRAHEKEVPAPLDALRRDVPPELSAVALRMLAKDRAQRYQSPREVAQALAPFFQPSSRALAEPDVRQPGPGTPTRLPVEQVASPRRANEAPPVWVEPEPPARWPWKAVAAGAGVLLLFVLVGLWATSNRVRTKPEAVIPAAAPADAVGDPVPARPVGNGHWQIEGNELVQSSAQAGRAGLNLGDLSWTDYDFEVSAQRIAGRDLAWLVFRAPDDGSCWWFGARHNAQVVGQHANHVGATREEARWTLDDEWHRFGVSVRGTHIKCSLDGATTFEFDDARYPRGGVGLHTIRSAVRFRDLTVRDAQGGMLCGGIARLRLPGPEELAKARQAGQLVATYSHTAGRNKPKRTSFYSNGRVGAPDAPHTWKLDVRTLVICTYSDVAPSGVWVDTCTLSEDGRTYHGRNQDGVAIAGERVEGDLRSAAPRQ